MFLIYFCDELCYASPQAATLISLLEKVSSPKEHAQAIADRDWWRQTVATADEDAAKVIFDLMATDPAGRNVNLYEVASQ